MAAVNLSAWAVCAVVLYRKRGSLSGEDFYLRRLQLLLSAGYVAGCAFRSFLPVYDVPRIVMVDSWWSSVAVGRSVATIAELCFVAQWAVVLRTLSRTTCSSLGLAVSRMLVPLIAVAEACSWYSVLTTANLGHVIEETLWGFCAAALVVSLVVISPRTTRALRHLLSATCIVGIAYVAYMFLVDVPMYWSRWIVDEASGRQYLGIAQGFVDASTRWTVSHSWQYWRHEVVWMSAYFSVAVWLSIAMIHAPLTYVQLRDRSKRPLPVLEVTR